MARKEGSFSVVEASGIQVRFRVLETVIIDDLLEVGMKGIAAEIKLGIPYESPFSSGVRAYLTKTTVLPGG